MKYLNRTVATVTARYSAHDYGWRTERKFIILAPRQVLRTHQFTGTSNKFQRRCKGVLSFEVYKDFLKTLNATLYS